MLKDNLFLKAEVYYQDLYGVPVDRDTATYFSIINFRDGFSDRPLANDGAGQNYGLELTLEKYFSDNYYFLITGSLFDSKYTASDKVERNTRFNTNYAMNVLAGKEFVFGSETNRKVFGLSLKSTVVGGPRLIPIDLEASIAADRTVRDFNRAFEEQGDAYFRADVQISFRKDRPKTTHILKLDIQNVTNRLNTFNLQYDSETQSIRKSTHLGLIPILSYKVKF
jgi:outer membrane receptor protein involved in Fe transport